LLLLLLLLLLLQIEHCLALLAAFTKSHTAVAGDMGSTLTTLRDAAAVKAKAVMDTYQTAEGVAKMHVDNVIVGHVGILNGMLGETDCCQLDSRTDPPAQQGCVFKKSPVASSIMACISQQSVGAWH
jgi:hypothetical protein